MTTRYCPSGTVTAYTGENGTVVDINEPPVVVGCGSLYSYKKPDGTAFAVNGHYVGTALTGPTTLNYDGHPGIDFPVPSGTDVLAAADGDVVVADASNSTSSGNYVRIQHGAFGYQSQYLHLSAVLVSLGQNVSRGQVIARSGGTAGPGSSVSPHLHFEVKRLIGTDWIAVDPYGWTGSGSDPYTAAPSTDLWKNSGTTPPEIRVQVGANNITDGQANAIDLGSTPQGQPSTVTFTVWNDGGQNLTLSAPSLPTGYTLTEALVASLAPGQNDTFTVALDTSSTGTKAGQISIANNDTDENPFNFPITGTVTPAHTTLETLIFKQWEQVFGGSGYDDVTDLQQTSDGGYVLIGYSGSGVSGNKTVAGYGGNDCWIVKTDEQGSKQWERVFGGSGDDIGLSIKQTSDGGYIMLASSTSGISGNKSSAGFGGYDFWLVKLDSNGDKLWEKVFGGTSDDQGTVLWQTSDGGCILGGGSASGVSGNKTSANFGSGDIWVIKVDASGNKQWEQNFGGNDNEGLYPHNGALKQTADGGFILAGHSRSPISGNKSKAGFGGDDFWLVKIDASGGKQWDQVFGGSGMDGSPAVDATSDGGYIIGGISESPVSGNKTAAGFGGDDGWLIKTDGNGNKQWEQVVGGAGSDYLFSLRQIGDGGYLLGLYSNSGVSGNKTTPSFGVGDFWLVKVDANGAKQWERAFGGSGDDGYRTPFELTSDGGLILGTGSDSGVSGNKTTPGFGQSDYWLVKLITREAPIGTPAVLANGQFSPDNTFTFFDTSSVPVTLETTFPNGTMRYTLDGSTPTASSTLYSGPFNVTQTSTLRAIAFSSDGSQSALGDAVMITIIPPPIIGNINLAGSTFTLSVSSTTRHSYVLEYKASLTASSWTIAQTVAGTGNEITLTDSSATSRTRFYRVQVK